MPASVGDALLAAAFTSFMQLGVFVAVPGAIALAAWRKPAAALPLIALYAVSYFDGAERCTRRKRVWPNFSRNFWLIRFMRNYFNQRVHIPASFPAAKDPVDAESQQFIFAMHPHGCMSEYRLLADGQFLDLLPGLRGRQICWLGASVLFRLPIARELCLWSGCVDASRTNAERMLKAGHSLGVIPGGEHEQLLTTYGQEIVYIKKRLGFVKLALRYGIPLVPCYVFGVSDLYHHSKVLIGFRMALVKKLGIALPICFGAHGLPAAPFKKPVDIVVGDPISFEKCPEPTEEQVVAAHAKYVAALQNLFDSNKAKYGYGDRVLQLQ